MLFDASAQLGGSPQDLHMMAVLWRLPILLSFNKATDNVAWGLQLSKSARALICGCTITLLCVRVLVHALVATSQQSVHSHFGFSLEQIVPQKRNIDLVVTFMPSLPPCVVAVQELPVAVHCLHPPSKIFHLQLSQRRD
jgi:hypothetical protein